MGKGVVAVEQIVEKCKGRFLALKEVFYRYKGTPKRWEVCSQKDSVAVLIYNRELDRLILVKQFRMPLFLKNGDGFAYELCAGLQDKEGLTPAQVAQEEVEEECGYRVELGRLQRITSTYGSVGSSASNQIIFYVEVTERDRVSAGGGLPEEDIELVYLQPEEVEQFVLDDQARAVTPGAKFALMWWLYNRQLGRVGAPLTGNNG
jgi:UDP-sugar diphosphatase